jgi:hypothetical protein
MCLFITQSANVMSDIVQCLIYWYLKHLLTDGVVISCTVLALYKYYGVYVSFSLINFDRCRYYVRDFIKISD